MFFSKIKKVLLDGVCILCGSKNNFSKIDSICEKCFNSLNIEIQNTCNICGHPLSESNLCPSCGKLGQIYYDRYSFIQFYSGFFFKNCPNVEKR